MKESLEDEQIGAKLGAGDRQKLEKACDETLRWIEKNQTAERDEFEFRMKEVQRVCNPVVAKLYLANAGGGGKGPRIEEMD